MTKLTNGKMANRVYETGVIVRLTPGTSMTVRINGKLGGTINGMAVSGSGSLEYTFNHGASTWIKSANGLASGPDLPAGPLKFLPSASGSMDFSTTGTIETAPDTYANSKKDRYNWPLKGRTASITVTTVDDNVDPCYVDLPTLCAVSGGDPGYCDGEGDCYDECIAMLELDAC